MVVEQQSIPTPALVLGLGGLIPFFSTAVLIWWSLDISQWLPAWLLQGRGVEQFATVALGAYAAVILSFLGGVRWGNLLFDQVGQQTWLPLTMSVIPSLIAWPALLLTPVPMFCLLVTGFLLQYALDVAAGNSGELPAWFLRLRLILTSGAVLSLLAGLSGSVVRM